MLSRAQFSLNNIKCPLISKTFFWIVLKFCTWKLLYNCALNRICALSFFNVLDWIFWHLWLTFEIRFNITAPHLTKDIKGLLFFCVKKTTSVNDLLFCEIKSIKVFYLKWLNKFLSFSIYREVGFQKKEGEGGRKINLANFKSRNI